jgi:hypothetical protein
LLLVSEISESNWNEARSIIDSGVLIDPTKFIFQPLKYAYALNAYAPQRSSEARSTIIGAMTSTQ